MNYEKRQNARKEFLICAAYPVSRGDPVTAGNDVFEQRNESQAGT
jgi:hypothetical protein